MTTNIFLALLDFYADAFKNDASNFNDQFCFRYGKQLLGIRAIHQWSGGEILQFLLDLASINSMVVPSKCLY